MTRLPAIPAPEHRTLRSANIRFCHPGYPSPVNVLFSLPRVDSTSSQPETLGVDSRVALLACQIIASNAFEKGYLAEDERGTRRVEAGPDSILTESEYWFFVEDDLNYPVVPSFREWEFPHGKVPSYWYLLNEPSSTTKRCPVTNTSYASTWAHLIPKEESDWFLLNNMSRYGRERWDIDDRANLVSLRSDIHICLDTRVFSFIPKPDGNGVHEFVPHVLNTSHTDFTAQYHNRTVRFAEAVCPEYFFARFAWAVIYLVKPFIISNVDRYVAKFVRAKTDSEGEGRKGFPKSEVQLLAGASLRSLYEGGGKKSASPKKRKASSPRDEASDDDDKADPTEDSEDDWYTEHLQQVLEQEFPRGRKRTRLSDSSFATNVSVPPLCHSPSNSSTVSQDSLCHPGEPELEIASEGKGVKVLKDSESVLRGPGRSFDTQ